MPTLKLSELHEFISCPVCKGYLIDATTVSECLHTFCKSCIIKHIKNDNNECPKCNTIIHERRPLDYIAYDRNKQDIVYKLVPQLYIKELKKKIRKKHSDVDRLTKYLIERKFLNVTLVMKENNLIINNDNKIINKDTNEEEEEQEMEDNVHRDELDNESPTNTNNTSPPLTNATTTTSTSQQVFAQKYQQEKTPHETEKTTIHLRCPFEVTVRHIRKILIMKYQLQTNDKITILYKGDIVDDQDLVSNLAPSLSFRFHYQISRLTSQEDHDKINNNFSKKRKNSMVQDDGSDNQHDDLEETYDDDSIEDNAAIVQHEPNHQVNHQADQHNQQRKRLDHDDRSWLIW